MWIGYGLAPGDEAEDTAEDVEDVAFEDAEDDEEDVPALAGVLGFRGPDQDDEDDRDEEHDDERDQRGCADAQAIDVPFGFDNASHAEDGHDDAEDGQRSNDVVEDVGDRVHDLRCFFHSCYLSPLDIYVPKL